MEGCRGQGCLQPHHGNQDGPLKTPVLTCANSVTAGIQFQTSGHFVFCSRSLGRYDDNDNEHLIMDYHLKFPKTDFYSV